jgi:uncharacterized protein (DUF433 family)
MSESPYIEQRNGGFYVRNSRVPLDVIVYRYKDGASVEDIRDSFPVLTLEEIHGSLAFYLGHVAEVEASLEEEEKLWEEFRKAHPAPADLKERLDRARQERLSQRR